MKAEPDDPRADWVWWAAAAPGAFAILLELGALIAATLGAPEGLAEVAVYLLPIGVVAAIAALVSLVLLRPRDWLWFVISACVSSLGILFGFLLWLSAYGVACNHHCGWG